MMQKAVWSEFSGSEFSVDSIIPASASQRLRLVEFSVRAANGQHLPDLHKQRHQQFPKGGLVSAVTSTVVRDGSPAYPQKAIEIAEE